MKQFLHLRRNGNALLFALIAILLISLFIAYEFKSSLDFSFMSSSQVAQKRLRQRASELHMALKSSLDSYMQAKIDDYRSRSENAPGTLPDVITDHALSNLSLPGTIQFDNTESYQLHCVSQGLGTDASTCTDSHLVFPKDFELKIMLRDSKQPDIALVVNAREELSPDSLNDFAYAVLTNQGDTVSFAGGEFGGKVAVNFANPNDNSNINFINPAPQNIIFDDVLMSNLDLDHVTYGIDDGHGGTLYNVGDVQMKKGFLPKTPLNSGDIYNNFESLKSQATIFPPDNTIAEEVRIRLGGESNPCNITVERKVVTNDCYSDMGPGGYRTNETQYFRLPRGDFNMDELLNHPYQLQIRLSGGQGPGNGGNETSNCTPTVAWAPYPGADNNSIPDGSVIYAPGKVVNIEPLDSGKFASVCNNFTILAEGGDVHFNSSVVRVNQNENLDDPVPANQANVAIVNLDHSNMIPKDAKALGTFGDTLTALKSVNSGEDLGTTFKLELSTVALTEGNSVLLVDPALINDQGSTRNDVGTLESYGSIITPEQTPTRRISMINNQLFVTGFTSYQSIYNQGIQLAPPPGMKGSSTSLPFVLTTISINFSFSDINAAQNWAANAQ